MTLAQQLRGHEFKAMASPIELQASLPEASAQDLFARIEQEFSQSEQCLSRFRADSELVALNGQLGRWTEVSPRLYEAATLAYRAYRLTHGVFDPRVLRILDDIGYKGAATNPSELGASALLTGATDATAVTDVTDATATLGVASSGRDEWFCRHPRKHLLRLAEPIDLGGIGKGLTVRRASRLARQVTDTFLVNAGGDLYVSGLGPGTGLGEGLGADHGSDAQSVVAQAGWSLGIENPFRANELAVTVQVPGGHALCTSSTKNRRWQHNGEAMHHLIHPFTGRPGGTGLVAVTVLSWDPLWSEIATKYLFLMGAEGIGAAARALNLAAWWFFEGQEIGMTRMAVPYMTWLSQDLGVREVVE